MITNNIRGKKAILIAAVSVVLGFGYNANSDKSKPSKLIAEFTMTRTLSILSDTITSSGKLTLGGPGLLRWETTSPGRSVLVVNKKKAWIQYPDLGVTKKFDIQDDPVMKLLSEHLLALTSGDFSKIELIYEVENQEDNKKRLIPKEPEIKKIFKEMRVELSSTGIASRVEMVSLEGDTTAIAFKNVRLNPQFSLKLFEEPK
ncbi:MAG: outer membrane lipoprotein carrier protein LolA [Proteobacteria bacterium]|nr:outer membrane lipoprotein carrier protein LolA [Pseudomonadota bacterium]